MLHWLSHLLILFLITRIILAQQPIALIGTILLTDKSIENGTVLIIDGRIAAVGARVIIPEKTVILYTNGVILPGLIDLHNHLTWNIFPRWQPSQEFGSRYEWQQKIIYKTLMSAPHQGLIQAGLSCEMQRYAEVKAISQGATSVIGSLRKPCNRGLARNLDDDPTLGQIFYDVFPLLMNEEKLQGMKDSLSSNGSLLIHLAEGASTDAASAIEFSILKARGLLRSGVSLIHGVALKENDFRTMADANVGFVWSPHSNINLYGETAALKGALDNQITTVIAPDWSPTGSDGLLSELSYAATWHSTLQETLFDDRSLLKMATLNAAKLVHLDNRLGALNEGYLADILVLRSNSSQSILDPFWLATHAIAEDVMLVMIDGKAIYGDPQMMKQLVDSTELESLEICGVEKSLSFPSHADSQLTFGQTQRKLRAAMRHWGRTLAPLSECGN